MVVLCVSVKAVLSLQAQFASVLAVACQSCNVVLCFCCVISVISLIVFTGLSLPLSWQ